MICQIQQERNVHFAMRWLPQFALDAPTEKEAKVGFSEEFDTDFIASGSVDGGGA